MRLIGLIAIRFMGVAIKSKEGDGAKIQGIIAFIARQREVIKIGASAIRGSTREAAPVVVAQSGPEAVGGAAVAISALVVADEGTVILTDIGINGAGFAIGVVVIADGDDEVGVPMSDEGSDGGFARGVIAIVADDGELDSATWRKGCRCWWAWRGRGCRGRWNAAIKFYI